MHLPFRHRLLPAALLRWVAPALAAPCTGRLPARGTAFSELLRYASDGSSLRIGSARRPDRWSQIRLADFYAPAPDAPDGRKAERALETLMRDRLSCCRAGRRGYDRALARCMREAGAFDERMRAAGAVEGERGQR